MKERDCAVEMWHLAELVINKKNEELKTLSSNNIVETLQKEITDVRVSMHIIVENIVTIIKMLGNKI